MPISIKNQKAEALANEVAKETGETLTQAVIHALEERLQKVRGKRTVEDLTETILKISKRCQSLPDLDTRSPEEILGYNDTGTFR